MVQKMTSPDRPDVESLAAEVGVPRSTLYRWVSDIDKLTPRTASEAPLSLATTPRPNSMKRPQDWSAQEKLAAVLEAASLSDEELGVFLRSRGLHEAQLQQWRDLVLAGLEPKAVQGTKKAPEGKRLRELKKELRRKDKALAETAAFLVLKKSSGDLGGRRVRRRGPLERQQVIALIDEATASRARLKPAAQVLALTSRTIQRWRGQETSIDRRCGPLTRPANKLTAKERKQVLAIANAPKYRDLPPKQIVPRLADEGIYVASESSFYRILREEQQLAHRERSRPPTHRRALEKKATGPCQVWSWDITYLKSTVAGRFFYLYMVMDIWSRKIIDATVFSKEWGQNSAMMLVEAYHHHGVDPAGLVLHSDNGGPMKGSTMLATLQRFGSGSIV